MKKFLLVISLLALLESMVLCVNAHSGRTDSNGGHTDSRTGEYHYHHGYPAHDHYDMDGDGDVDCPYDFEDKTSHSYNDNSQSKEEQQPTTQQTIAHSNTQSESKKISDGLVVGIAIAIILLSWVLFIWLCSLT